MTYVEQSSADEPRTTPIRRSCPGDGRVLPGRGYAGGARHYLAAWRWWPPHGLPERLVPYARTAIAGIGEGRAHSQMGW
ncbi:hypothetical protein EF912_17965 [Streptomyces sp. WAC07061]|uniref:hypothetical protein n=1 Tax=Streptomyces sp. WAC07061 TaxID=2487410 RepID=UPI000F77CD62|nr:hypothetical protein [Streptomyces sp. WAC07061]RSS53607.1 hypothetical protein EF912_17965 [Streptomyces sp. WAC07061]